MDEFREAAVKRNPQINSVKIKLSVYRLFSNFAQNWSTLQVTKIEK